MMEKYQAVQRAAAKDRKPMYLGGRTGNFLGKAQTCQIMAFAEPCLLTEIAMENTFTGQ